MGGDASAQARWVGAREGLGLVGVITASVLPSVAGWPITLAVLALAAALGWVLLRNVAPPTPTLHATQAAQASQASEHFNAPAGLRSPHASPWQHAGFRVLMMVHLIGGLASAIPATLVLFFVRDALGAPGWAEGAMLGLYFVAAASAMPLWAKAVDLWGLVRCWLAGMVMAIAGFVGAMLLGPGDLAGFALVCLLTGLALGADLVAGPALLGLLARQATGKAPDAAGQWFGWWNLVSKLTLALAAGLALPLVQWAGYVPGQAAPSSLQALTLMYAALPCVIKSVAVALLWRWRHLLFAAAAHDEAPTPSSRPQEAVS